MVGLSRPSGQPSPPTPAPCPRVPFTVRGRGLAAGTLLACGSVLAVAVHTADSSLPQGGTPPSPRFVTADPQGVSRGATAPLVVIEGWAASAAVSSGQALAGTHFPAEEVRHHVPLVRHSSGSPTSGATLSLPSSLPDVGETQGPRSAPVDRMVVPVAQTVASFARQSVPERILVAPEPEFAALGEQDLASSGEGSQPAMTMLSSPLLA